ncbi:MAG: HEAT repeat domain-containing protein [Desulfovermiculus sp.]
MEAHKRNEHVIREIQHDISTHDTIKAELVLQDISAYPAPVQKRLLFEISRAADSFALPLLAFLWHMHRNIFSAYPGLYDIFLSKARHNMQFVLARIQPREKNLPAYAWLCGELHIPETGGPLLDVLHKVAQTPTIASIIEALGRIAEPRAVKPLAEFVQVKNSPLAVQAATALGRIGTEQAIHHLDRALGHYESVDQAIVAACGELQTQPALRVLNRALIQAHPPVQDQAAETFARLGSSGLSTLHANLHQGPFELRLRSLVILGQVQDQSSFQPIRRLLNAHPEEKVRTAAYEVLGGLALTQGAYVLVSGLMDTAKPVRLAAARAADQNADSMMLHGIRNLLHDEDSQALLIVRTLFQAQAETLLTSLWESPRFRQLAVRAAESCRECSTHELLASLPAEDIHPDNR